MSLNRQIASQIYYGIGSIIEKIAKFFGYPDNPGMPVSSRFSEIEQLRLEKLPMHQVRFPPEPVPNNLIEVLFGVIPKTDTIKRVFYESPSEGYYNFYIQDFKNAYFLPDQLSEIIQVFFKVCLDTSGLEAIREVLFISLIAYYNILNLRLCMFWFLSINPYTYPWLFLVYLVDWTEDILQGLVPVVAGVNLTATFWFILIGKVADSLNHLVFTMPFLPSEAQRAQTIINGQVENILLYRFLPILWFKETIPNEIREFWYYNRPDILKFMQKSYGHLNITLLPDSILASMPKNENINMINLQQQESEALELGKSFSKQQVPNSLTQDVLPSGENVSEKSLSRIYLDENRNLSFIFNHKESDIEIIDLNHKPESIESMFDPLSPINYNTNSSEFFSKHLLNSIGYSEVNSTNLIKHFDINFGFDKSILEEFGLCESRTEVGDINNSINNFSTYILSDHKLIQINEFNNSLTQLIDPYHFSILFPFDK